MSRFKLTIEYDGTPFHGWQRVQSGPSVQGALMDAVEKLTGRRGDVVGAGRTDSGVHALGQVAHVDIAKDLTADVVRDGLNAHLRPLPISVRDALLTSDDFHARFWATERRYLYRILNRRSPPALERAFVWHFARPLDRDAMDRAAQRLVGRHDFTTFRDAQCQAKSPVKTLLHMNVTRAGEEIHIWCAAQSFLHRQVRSMVGTIVEAGLGKLTPEAVSAALAARDRSACGPVAPAAGLHLMRVEYGHRSDPRAEDDDE